MWSPIQTLTQWASTGARGTMPLPSTTLWLAASQTDGVSLPLSTFTQSSAINNLLDRLVLFSPRTWYGVLQAQTQSTFNRFDGIVLLQSLVGTLVPWMVLAYGLYKYGSIRQREFLWKTITPAVWLSPWTLSTFHGLVLQLIRLYPPLRFYWKGRMEALPSAVYRLNKRVGQGKVTRHRRYDIYWPSTATSGTMDSEPKDDAKPSNTTSSTTAGSLRPAILILPGVGISHVAYSEVASRLADAGILTAVVSMEPLRFPHRHLGADVVSLTRIMQRIQGDNNAHQPQQQYEWHLLGHSGGGFASMQLYQQLHTLQQQHKNPSLHIGKLILWGCAALVHLCTDLSRLFPPTDPVSILVVQATQDSMLEMTNDLYPEFQQHFPTNQTRTEWIQGGTHHGFASYESTWAGSPDMATAISYSEQQSQACDLTIDFLLPTRTVPTNDTIQDDLG